MGLINGLMLRLGVKRRPIDVLKHNGNYEPFAETPEASHLPTHCTCSFRILTNTDYSPNCMNPLIFVMVWTVFCEVGTEVLYMFAGIQTIGLGMSNKT